MTAIAVLGFGLTSLDAHALALGRVIVQSALGEPLRAEIEIPEINADEAASLRTSVASPETFKAAGLEYNAVIANLQISLQRRADGRAFLRLSSDRAMNDPFVDLILEASWSSGKIVRDYTMLFDPPNLRAPAPEAPSQAQLPAAASVQVAPRASLPAAAAPFGAPPAAARAPAARAPAPPAAPAAVQAVRPAAATAKPAPAVSGLPGTGRKVVVKSGDTASAIAGANKPASVSLDQMLVALLRSNPDAFISGNVNRLKSGAVLDIPGAEQAASVSAAEANQTIVAQSRDFNEFRRKLAAGIPVTQAAAPTRQTGGKIEAKVEEKKPATTAPDKLTLSKGAIQGKDNAAQDALAKQREAKDAASRVAELSKNISELNKLAAATIAAPAAGASAPKAGVNLPVGAAAPAVPVAASKTVAVTASAAPAAASAPAKPAATASAAVAAAAAAAAMAAAPAPAAAASAPAPKPPAPAKPVVVPPPPPPPPETSLMDDVLDNPFVLPGAGVFVAALAGFAFWRSRQRKKAAQVDSSFLESRLQPDSFFGASGGQRVDTNDGGGATGSSMVYSPSQLDAAGDVDPVAEADVYLAYGRDLQAEEILKEAMRTNPARVAIYTKLLEIYAKRRDAKAFEVVAVEVYNLTRGKGPDWEHVCGLGRDLDGSNDLYQPGGEPASSAHAGAAAGQAGGPDTFAQATAPMTIAPQLVEPDAAGPVDFDLDLDFSLGDETPPAPAPVPPASISTQADVDLDLMMMGSDEPELKTVAMNAAPTEPMPLDMDFGSAATVAVQAYDKTQAFSAPPEPVKLSVPDLALSSNGLSFSPEPPPSAAPAPKAPAPAHGNDGMIEFDLDSLSLDLDSPSDPDATMQAPIAAAAGPHDPSDPLETKLALAEEFQAIGDTDGARALIQEVADEASGAVKVKAQKLLAELA